MAYKGKYLNKYENTKKRKKPKFIIICLIVCLFLVAASFVIYKYIIPEKDASWMQAESSVNILETSAPTLETTPQEQIEVISETEPVNVETEPSNPDPVIRTASVGVMGDLLMHGPIFQGSEVQQSDDTYNFESVFKYITNNASELDYAVINLETTLAGLDNGYAYGGNPSFNCPDGIIDGIKNAGFDMLLTANEHCSDTTILGFQRTLEVARNADLETLGTYLSDEETNWTIKDINGINIGMMCYTWATSETEDGRPSLNGNAYIPEVGLCNYFRSNNLDSFYEEVEGYMNEMEEAGADATIMFIHWGDEYQLSANDEQKSIAQKLCDIGIDVIVGSHPHVVQPIELIESKVNEEHKTICIYSTGSAVSNQRFGNISDIDTAHTEDGVLFYVIFEKVDDGEAYIADINVLPTWVNMYTNGNWKREYNILPLGRNEIDNWMDEFELDDETFQKAQESYNRTMEILEDGLNDVKEYLSDTND